MSDEKEKAAKWDMLQEYQQVRSHLGLLENEFKRIATAWRSMAEAFNMTYGVAFAVTENQIAATNVNSGTTIAVLPKNYIEFENAVSLIRDYQNTTKRKAELENNLGDTIKLTGM